MTSALEAAKRTDHAALADALRRRVLEGTAETFPILSKRSTNVVGLLEWS
jgi:hypothetical protein